MAPSRTTQRCSSMLRATRANAGAAPTAGAGRARSPSVLCCASAIARGPGSGATKPTDARSRPRPLRRGEALLEPVVGVGVVVVARDLGVAAGAVHRLRLDKRAVRVEAHGVVAERARPLLERVEQPGAEAQAAVRAVDPHAHDLADPGRKRAQRAAARRLAVE